MHEICLNINFDFVIFEECIYECMNLDFFFLLFHAFMNVGNFEI